MATSPQQTKIMHGSSFAKVARTLVYRYRINAGIRGKRSNIVKDAKRPCWRSPASNWVPRAEQSEKLVNSCMEAPRFTYSGVICECAMNAYGNLQKSWILSHSPTSNVPSPRPAPSPLSTGRQWPVYGPENWN
ncbi:hypothetical protein NDU88_000816 [Pleurodeles waltl]|uniref:Uncharacterized protein n=1 Tax=Pleurodeles waltl TaxID=8319 RepID=A0AAV7MIL5_PLEWA|nr:hypothetical protein NDU88_000816 [Pleurodeles waltl]